jgi:hypothetical protein
MQREHAQIMKITNVFYPISAYRSFSIFILKLKYFKNKSLFSSPTVLKTTLLLQEFFSQTNALNCFIVNKFVEFVVMRMTK